ncbi:hypothetical protein CTI12_AA391600 [Artemisia annua]|uniref:Ulp1 protease family, C-terminal catalytic domain-containing protein n=1 Tax=Artemisia annua TaxID=35608 RepID=A0A2U1MDV1_ARTAN|nr:hypothetical protein CTI12_AA391600 [Artemisia annua]
MNLRLPTGNLQISPQTVRLVLGLPMGSRRLERNEDKEKRMINLKKNGRINTKMKTIANTLGACGNNSVVKTTVLENILEEDDVTEIDWCRYVYECARSSKEDWATRKKDRTEVVYYGPVTFLMLAYLQYTKFDAMNVPRRLPAFKSWNANLMISRETLELDRIKYFGMVDIIRGLNEQEQTAQKEMLEDKIEIILSEKELFEQTIVDTISMFGNDGRLNQYKERLNEIFRKPNGNFKGKSPLCSSSTESNGIKFATSDDEDDNNGDANAEYGEENGESMIIDDDEDDKHDATNDENGESKFDEGALGNGNGGSSSKKNEASGDNEGSSNLRDESARNNKLEDLTDEEFFEVFQDAEWKSFGNQKNVEEKHTEQTGVSSQKEKENEEAGPSSCKSREHSFEFTPEGSQPSFNLGFDTPEEESKPFKKTESDSDDEEKQSRCLQSPYLYKRVSTTEEITKDEILLARSIFCMQGEEAEQVFDDQHVGLMRMNVQSLAPGLKIESPVIDTFASILNYEEWKSEKEIKRHYLYTSMMDKQECMLTKIYKQYDEFAKIIAIQMEDDISKLQFDDVNLVFFPIIAHDHYYLIVFNIFKGASVIIDNSDSGGTYEGKYKENYDLVKGVFAKHWSTYEHPIADQLMNPKKQPTILNMSWRTKKEKIDCGLYTKMHMDHYNGKSGTTWET